MTALLNEVLILLGGLELSVALRRLSSASSSRVFLATHAVIKEVSMDGAELVQALHYLGLKHLVCKKDTREILGAFFNEQDADDKYFIGPSANMVRGQVVEYGPAIHIEFCNSEPR